MNLEERSTVNHCQERTAEEFLSPTRRSSRIKKPKISVDFCNIDETVVKKTVSGIKESLIEKSKQSVSVSVSANNSEVNFIDNKDNELSKSHKGLEKNSSFFQMDSDEEESFETMFDDIFGQKYSKSLQSLLPKKVNNESVKDRKFLKKNCLDSPNHVCKGYIWDKNNLPTEDVDKVFKIISKPNILSDIPSDSKTSSKPCLKTYCNKRKSFQKSSVVESFGLPDYPIIPENVIKPILNNKLDAEVLDVSEITILDLQYINEPWVFTNIEGESLFPFYEEVRIKAEPVKHECCRKYSSFDSKCIENSELCNELNIYTSTPQKDDIISDEIICASLNSIPKDAKTVFKNKEIDIDAIKMNFKKMLSRKFADNFSSKEETREKIKIKVKRNISPKKSAANESKHNNISVSTDISFVETDSLTIENKEFEISNSLPVPKKSENQCSDCIKRDNKPSKQISSLCYSITNCEDSNTLADALVRKDSKIIRKRLRSSISHPLNANHQQLQKELVMEECEKLVQSNPQKTKKIPKSSACKNKISSENEGTDKRDFELRKSPKKKIQKTDVFTKQSLRSFLSTKEKQSEEAKDITCSEENKKLITNKDHESNNLDNTKRMLRSSSNNACNLQTLKISTSNENSWQMDNSSEKYTGELINIDANCELNHHNCTKEELLLNSIIKSQTEKLETLKMNLRSKINFTSKTDLMDTPLDSNQVNNEEVNVEKKITNILTPSAFVTSKRKLRSRSQENLIKEVGETITSEENKESMLKNSELTKTCTQQKNRTSRSYVNEEIKSDVKINLEKLRIKTDVNICMNDFIQNTSMNKNKTTKEKSVKSMRNEKKEIQLCPEIILQKCNISNSSENLSKNEDMEKMLFPLKKGKRSIPEIRIIINPLNVIQLLDKLPNIGNTSGQMEIVSHTKRKLRSTKAIIDDDMSKEKKPVNEPSVKESSLKNKTGPQKEASSKEKGVLNHVASKPRSKTIETTISESSESVLSSTDHLLNKEPETSTNTNNKLRVEQVNSHNEEKNLPTFQTPKKNRKISTIETSSNDVDNKKSHSCITDNNFEVISDVIINNSSNGHFGVSSKELENPEKENLDYNEKLSSSTVKTLQKHTAHKMFIVNTIPRKATSTDLKTAEINFNDLENTDSSVHMVEILSKSKNFEQDGESENTYEITNSQECNSSKSQIKNTTDIFTLKSMSDNVKSDLPKQVTQNDNMIIYEMEEEKETFENTASGKEKKIEIIEIDSNMKIENMIITETRNNMVEVQKADKHAEVYEKEKTLVSLQKGTSSRSEQWKEYLTSNKLVTIKINPYNSHTCLIEKDEKNVQSKLLSMISKGLTEEKTKPISSVVGTRKLNNCLDLEIDLLKEIPNNTKEFVKIASSEKAREGVNRNAAIIADLKREEAKLHMNSSDGLLRDPLKKIDLIDIELRIDDNAVDKEEKTELIKSKHDTSISQIENEKSHNLSCNLLIDVDTNYDSEEDCLEIAEIFDRKIAENRENESNLGKRNLKTTNEVTTSTSSVELDFDDEIEKKLTDSVANSRREDAEVSCRKLDMNIENIGNEKKNRLTSNKSKENKQSTKKKLIKKVENEQILFSPRLREKWFRSVADKANTSILEESSKKNNSTNKIVYTETTTKDNQSGKLLEHNDSINLKMGDLPSKRISRRSMFDRKLNISKNVVPQKEDEITNGDNKYKSGRPSRRKSIDEIDLLNTEREQYRFRLRRSKSVIPSALERKMIEQDDSKITIKRGGTRSNIKVATFKVKRVENGSKFKRSKSLSHGTLHSRNKSVERDYVFNGNSKKSIEKPCDKKTSRPFKEKMSMKSKATTNNKENMGIRDIDLEDEDINFQVGDLAWAQIGSHPFWPCLVTEEPETGLHSKIFRGMRGQRILYHVRFFGDHGRRAWINKNQMLIYSNHNDLKLLSDKMKAENNSPTLLQAYIIKPNKLKKWESAVDEAEHLKSKSIHEKLWFFIDMFASKAEKKQKEFLFDDSVSAKSEPLLVNRKRKERSFVSEDTFDISLNSDSTNEGSPVRKRFKKRISTETNMYEENDEATTSKRNIEVDNIKTNKNFEDENVLSRLRVRKQVDEISEIYSKTSSDNTTDTTLYSMTAQKALFKRNNLFKGVPREKVCQYCYQPEAVLKCRGRCNGPYHVECATKILQEKVEGRKKKEKNTSSNNLVHNSPSLSQSKIISEESKSTKNVDILEHTKNDKNKHVLLEEDHVQIITVPSSVYNTPPRKTFPPNFKNMTLAEQIDYKMKEIMKKFESKTFYAESSTDSSSEENFVNQPLSKVKHFSRCEGLFTNSSTFDKESKVNCEEKKTQELHEIEVQKYNDLSDKPSTSTVVEKLVENKDNSGKSEKKSKLVGKQKPFIAHITADFDSLDSSTSDIKEEDKSTVTESVDTIETVNTKNFKCGFCISNLDPFCFICNQAVSKRGSSIRQKCSLYQCGRFYHPQCLKMWPQTQWSLIQTTKHKDSDEAVDSFVCPLHVCHTCASDDPRAATSRCSGDKIVKCLRCPSTYHSTNLCVPAGTTILSSTQIICPRHRGKLYTINTTWCFLCSQGGNLICCETCPTSVHPECLPVNLTDDDKFICEDCESGRLPLYDEIVWVKLGKFRWWPALILFPNEIPDNIMRIKHDTGEFVVKFFGTYDYHWVNRGRSFLFQEGDTGHCNYIKKKVDAAFNTAVEEAVIAHKSKKEFKLSQEAESMTSLKPPPYIRIKVNRPVGNVRQMDLDLSSTNACECDPSQPNPCGPESDCLNRLLLTECSPDVCPAGKRCKNQSFDKREYPPLVPYKTQGRGWGLKTLAPIKKGQFVVEYVGEMIDIEEYQRRIQKMHEQKEENYYFLTIDKDRMLDAGPKGNVARFMNHCCQPNCETQKWTVNGDTRVGLFATEDISADTELTFNYNLECVGKEKKICRCGAPNCSGFIGVKAKQDTDSKKPKKSYKKKKPEEPVILPPCFICRKKGNVGICNNKVCNNAYHLKCLKIMEWPEGNKFICPWHNCNICSKRTIRCCVKCVNSYCPSHSEGNIRYDNLLGFVCNNHDPMNAVKDDEPIKLRKKNDNVITDESAVTSTTSDDLEDEDVIPLILRIKNRRKKKEVRVDSESDNDFEVTKSDTSTPFKRQTDYSDRESQDESTVSSATVFDAEDNIIKRKRGRPRKEDLIKKKLKLSNLQSTASSSLKDDNSLRNSHNCELSSSHNELENR